MPYPTTPLADPTNPHGYMGEWYVCWLPDGPVLTRRRVAGCLLTPEERETNAGHPITSSRTR